MFFEVCFIVIITCLDRGNCTELCDLAHMQDDCRDPDGFDPGVKKKHNVFLSGRGQTRRMLRSTKKNKKKKKNKWKKKDWKWIR